MKAEHTPGPWSMCLERRGVSFLVRDTDGRLVCEMSWHSSSRQHYPLRNESEANARLIAAAPLLLTTGESVCEAWDRYWSGGRSEADAVKFVKAISAQREVLAAATWSTHE